ncbi:MAG: ATP-dependent helicase, partial [Nitrospirae bacterium]|nr:ATP-dependent helicase [Nitrospirota bacterium]
MKQYILKTEKHPIKTSIDYMKELNEQQYAAVTAGDGPLLVLAGAGSGKTRTLTYRVSYLIERGVNPSQILIVTFTNRASREMLQRVEMLLSGEIKGIWGGTFHHVGNLILRKYAKALGYESNFTILDNEDTKDLLSDCIVESGIDTKAIRFPKAGILEDIGSLSVNCEKEIADTILEQYPYLEELTPEIERALKIYKEKKQKANLMDFDDLLLNWHRLLKEQPKIKERLAMQFQHILVDEFQDTNKLQSDIIDEMASHYKNLMVVGDDAQSIYSFRGAEFRNILEFKERYPDVQIFKLETNYRSTPQILHLSNESIKHNIRQFPKELHSIKSNGPIPVVVPLNNAHQQAEFVSQRIVELVDEGYSLNEIAVLYRAHYHSVELQMELTKRNIPFEIRSGLRFFEQAHIKDVIAHLKFVHNPFDELSCKRILKLNVGIGSKTASAIWDVISKAANPLSVLISDKLYHLLPRGAREAWPEFYRRIERLSNPPVQESPAEMIRIIMEESYTKYLQSAFTNYYDRAGDLEELSNFAVQYDSLNKFLSEIAL